MEKAATHGTTGQRYLPVLSVTNTHGISGEMKCALLCDAFDSLASVKTVYTDADGSHALTVASKRMHGAFLLLRITEITTVEQAEALKGHTLYADRDAITVEPDTFFIADLIGLSVIDADSGRIYGTLIDVVDNPANQLYEIQTETGKVLFPVIRQFIDRVVPGDGIYIRPIPGFFEGE